jgi:hypothetical protein
MPTRYVPPSGFGYPLDGLLPSIPCRFSFTPAALMGFTLRSFLLSKGFRGVTTRMDPLTVLPVGIPAPGTVGRPNRLRFPGFDPFESPLRLNGCLVRLSPDAPLGFFPLRVRCRKPCGGFLPHSSLALCRLDEISSGPPAPQSIDWLSTGPVHVVCRDTPAGRDDPYRVLAPTSSQSCE